MYNGITNQNIYEVNIRQYTVEGTFNAFATHLPRLQHMGVKIIWLMPIYPIGVKNRKGSLGSYYSISNFKAVNNEFGSAHDLVSLITQIHAMGMKVILDWIANHAAWDNVWAIDNPDYFLSDTEGNFLQAFDWDDVIQINHANASQQMAMINAMEYWVTNFDIDGFRADLAHLTPLPFWMAAKAHLTTIKKHLIWLAETEEPTYHQVFDISYTWRWMHEIELFCQGKKSLLDAVNVLESYKTDFPTNAIRMFFTSNHDENSWNGTEYEKYGKYALNLAVFSCCFVGLPLLYTGQELPNTNRFPFFDKAPIVWRPINDLHTFYKTLYTFRSQTKLYSTATLAAVKFNYQLLALNILAFSIEDGDDEVVVFLNFNPQTIENYVPLCHSTKVYRNVFLDKLITVDDDFLLTLPSAGYLVLEKTN